jgi:hypothetical protein
VAGSLTADITLSAQIKTADTGARVVLSALGLRAFNAAGAMTVGINTDGTATFSGSIQGSTIMGSQFATAASGTRLVINDRSAVKANEILFFGPFTGPGKAGTIFTVRGAVEPSPEASAIAILSEPAYDPTYQTTRSRLEMYWNHVNLQVQNDFGNRSGGLILNYPGVGCAIITSQVSLYVEDANATAFAPVVASAFTIGSSGHFKKGVKSLDEAYALDFVRKLRTVEYRRSEPLTSQFGPSLTIDDHNSPFYSVIAEEVAALDPNITIRSDGHLKGAVAGKTETVDVMSLLALTMAAVSQLATQVDTIAKDRS